MTRAPGELVDAPDYALAFRLLEPPPESASRLLVLVHGWSGDETRLAALAPEAAAGTVVALPRGPRSADEARFGWYRVSFPDGRPTIELDEARDSLRRLGAFIAQLQARHDVPPSRTVVAGFSQGGVLAASLGLTAPECVAGFGLLCGRIADELARPAGTRDALARLHGFVAHGDADRVLSFVHARQAQARLRALGVPHVLHAYETGHELTAAMRRDFHAWFADPAMRWNGPDA